MNVICIGRHEDKDPHVDIEMIVLRTSCLSV